jgi:hypothetical protein
LNFISCSRKLKTLFYVHTGKNITPEDKNKPFTLLACRPGRNSFSEDGSLGEDWEHPTKPEEAESKDGCKVYPE